MPAPALVSRVEVRIGLAFWVVAGTAAALTGAFWDWLPYAAPVAAIVLLWPILARRGLPTAVLDWMPLPLVVFTYEMLHRVVPGCWPGTIDRWLADADLALFFDDLRRAGLWDDTLVVVTADHGEAFDEHGFLMHTTAHEEVLRVPLVVKWPKGARAGVETERFSTALDLAPTILAHFGLGAPDLTGRDLARQVLVGGSEQPHVHVHHVLRSDAR